MTTDELWKLLKNIFQDSSDQAASLRQLSSAYEDLKKDIVTKDDFEKRIEKLFNKEDIKEVKEILQEFHKREMDAHQQSDANMKESDKEVRHNIRDIKHQIDLLGTVVQQGNSDVKDVLQELKELRELREKDTQNRLEIEQSRVEYEQEMERMRLRKKWDLTIKIVGGVFGAGGLAYLIIELIFGG